MAFDVDDYGSLDVNTAAIYLGAAKTLEAVANAGAASIEKKKEKYSKLVNRLQSRVPSNLREKLGPLYGALNYYSATANQVKPYLEAARDKLQTQIKLLSIVSRDSTALTTLKYIRNDFNSKTILDRLEKAKEAEKILLSIIKELKKDRSIKKYIITWLMVLSSFLPIFQNQKTDKSEYLNKEASKVKILDIQEGIATIYAGQFEGKETKSGEIFRQSKISAAVPKRSRWAPEHKGKQYIAQLTNIDIRSPGYGKSITVSLKDVGNFGEEMKYGTIKHVKTERVRTSNGKIIVKETTKKIPRIVDLSKKAALELGIINDEDMELYNVMKSAKVRMEILG